MGENKKVANSVVAVSSAAVLAIYGAGYERTRAAADRFAQQAADRRPHVPAPSVERERAPLTVEDAAPTPAQPAVPAPPVTLNETPRALDAAPVTKPAAAAAATVSAPPAKAKAAQQPDTTIAANTAETGPTAEDDAAPVQTAPVTPPVAPAPAAPAESAKAGYKDGTYYGWGTSRHGDIQAAVVIEEGKIAVARVERCLTRYSCNWIIPIPPRILVKQGTTYDYVSGATESSDAFQDAVAEALSQAK